MMKLGGAYAHMYQVQSSYYEKEAEIGNIRNSKLGTY